MSTKLQWITHASCLICHNDYFLIAWRGRTSSSNTNTNRNNIYCKYYKLNQGTNPILNESNIIYVSNDSTNYKAENWNYETEVEKEDGRR